MGASVPASEGWLPSVAAAVAAAAVVAAAAAAADPWCCFALGELEKGAACEETSGREGGCERANSAPRTRSYWVFWITERRKEREREREGEEKEQTNKQTNERTKKKKKKKKKRWRSKCPLLFFSEGGVVGSRRKSGLQHPLQPLSVSYDQLRHRPKPLPSQNRGWKAVPESGERCDAARGGKLWSGERSRPEALTIEHSPLSLSRFVPRAFSRSASRVFLPASRQSVRRSCPRGRGATRTSQSRSWPAGDTWDSLVLLSSATTLLPLGPRCCCCSRSWWQAFLWRKKTMRSRASADLLRRRRR